MNNNTTTNATTVFQAATQACSELATTNNLTIDIDTDKNAITMKNPKVASVKVEYAPIGHAPTRHLLLTTRRKNFVTGGMFTNYGRESVLTTDQLMDILRDELLTPVCTTPYAGLVSKTDTIPVDQFVPKDITPTVTDKAGWILPAGTTPFVMKGWFIRFVSNEPSAEQLFWILDGGPRWFYVEDISKRLHGGQGQPSKYRLFPSCQRVRRRSLAQRTVWYLVAAGRERQLVAQRKRKVQKKAKRTSSAAPPWK